MDAGSTFVHLLEKKIKVYYRKDIKFTGFIMNKKKKNIKELFHFFRE